jgi:hypothetical protein
MRKKMSEIKCPTCGESEPGTGNCGTSDSDTKALCKVQPECSCRNESQECTEASNCRVLKMFEPTITAVAKGEPAHFRAVLCSEQQNQAIGVVPKVVGFVDKKAAEQFILEKRDFQGWRYNLEPLYTEAPAVAQSWELNEETAKFLADLILANDEPTPVTLSVGFIKDDDGKIQHGLRVHESEYPEEGAELLVESTPSPQKSPPAEVVRELVEALELADATLEGAHMNADIVYKKVKAALKSAKEHGL